MYYSVFTYTRFLLLLLFVFFCFATIEFPKLVRLSIYQHIDTKIINKGALSSRPGPMLVFLL